MDVLIRATFENGSGLPADRISNSFAFHSDTPADGADLAELTSLVANFYTNVPANGLVKLIDCYSPEVSRGPGMRLDVYDITGKLSGGPDMGAPIYETVGVLPAAVGAQGLPAEVACVLTLEGEGRADAPVETDDGSDPGTERDRPMQRRTGRLYLGPLNVNCLTLADGQIRPHAQIRDTARLAANDLAFDAFAMQMSFTWSVWSRRNAALYPIVAVSTDNAFDTQRRRGGKATARQREVV